MKRLLTLTLLTGSMLLSTGCAYRIPYQNEIGASPAYSARERMQQIDQNWAYEGQMLVEDFDHFWLLRPASRLTPWHAR